VGTRGHVESRHTEKTAGHSTGSRSSQDLADLNRVRRKTHAVRGRPSGTSQRGRGKAVHPAITKKKKPHFGLVGADAEKSREGEEVPQGGGPAWGRPRSKTIVFNSKKGTGRNHRFTIPRSERRARSFEKRDRLVKWEKADADRNTRRETESVDLYNRGSWGGIGVRFGSNETWQTAGEVT